MTVTALEMPPTTGTFGNLSLVVLPTVPDDLESITAADLEAGTNISCHMVGDWWPTSETATVAAQRKMCQTNVPNRLGETTYSVGTLTYTYMPQEIATPGAEGNEAYEALPPRSTRVLVQRIGVSGKDPLAEGDAYRAFVVQVGPQDPAASAEDAGGEAVIIQALGFAPGYDAPVDGVVAAAA